MTASAALVACGSVFVFVACAVTLYHFAQKEVGWLSFSTSLLGFVLSFIIIALVPYDVSEALGRDDRDSGQEVLVGSGWELIYWATFLLCWILCPLLIEYEAAGDFTVLGKLRASLRRNIAWCAGYIVCGFLLLIWLSIGGGTHGSLGAWCIAASNAWGLLVSTVLMGYGLVAVPRHFWRLANPGQQLQNLYCAAVTMDEARLSTQFELQDVISEARAEIRSRSSQIWDPALERAFSILQMTLEECELMHLELSNGAPTPQSRLGCCGAPSRSGSVEDSSRVRIEYLAQLHRALKQAGLEARRAACRWEEMLRRCLSLEDIEEHLYPTALELAGSWNCCCVRQLCHWHGVRSCWHSLVLFWLATLRPKVLRVIGALCGLLSAVIVLGQLTMFSDSWSLSLLSLLFQGQHSFGLTQVMCTLALGYMVCTAYWSVFRLKIAGWYGLYSNHNTDTGSLLWCASVLARLAAPLCYHFLLLIRVKGTTFQAMMGQMNVVPVLGRSFNEMFPILIAFLCLCNLLNVYSKLVLLFGLDALEFEWTAPSSTADAADLLAEGHRLVERERRKRSEDRSLQLELNDRTGERRIPLRLQIASLIEDGTLPTDWNAASPN